MAARSLRLTVIALLLLAVAAGLGTWRVVARRRAIAMGRVQIELRYHVQPERAAEQAFLTTLDRLVRRLRDLGLRIGRVLPEPKAARVQAPGLDGEKLAAAMTGLPLSAGAVSGDGEVRVELSPLEAQRVADAALQQTARELRQRVLAADPCHGCEPAVVLPNEGRDGLLVLRLPWMDDATERRVKAAIGQPPMLPAPISLASERTVGAEPAELPGAAQR